MKTPKIIQKIKVINGKGFTLIEFLILMAIIGILAAIAIPAYLGTSSKWQRTIVNDVRPLLEACKSIGDSGSVTIRGKALVWDMRSDSRSGAHGMLPSELKASSSDSKITVFMVLGERTVHVGTYSISGQPGYRQYMDICVADWPEKKAVGMASVVSKEPRQARPVQHSPEYGDPNEPIVNWIASLPRSRQ